MEEETAATTTFWCHTCSQTVTPVTESDIKCPFCQSGFLEEMQEEQQQQRYTNVESNRSMDSVLTPIFFQMMNNSSRNGTDMDSQLQEILRRRGRRPVSVDQLLQGIYAGLTLAPADTNNAHDDGNRERGRVMVTNPYNQIVAVPSSAVSDTLPPVAGSLSEYFIGPDFEAFLESLTETDPIRYGTPPARRDAVEALADVVIEEEGMECCVCLDDVEMGSVGKQMPCKHTFHAECLLPWLELHSSCPVCRYQLPVNGTETNGGGSENRDGDGDGSMLDPMET